MSLGKHLLTSFCQASKAKRKDLFTRAETYVKEYLAKEREEIRLKRAARQAGNFYVPSQAKVYFVIRIRGCVSVLFAQTIGI